MVDLEKIFDELRTAMKESDSEIKRLNKELYDKEGDLSRIKSLWEKEKLVSSEWEKKLKKLNELFKGVN